MGTELQAAIWGAVAGAVMSLVTAIIANVVLEPKKQRISEYNEAVKLLKTIFSESEELITEYWSNDIIGSGLQFKCTRKRTQIYAALEEIHRRQNGHINYNFAVSTFTAYFDLVTSGSFGSTTHFSDEALLNSSARYAQACENEIEAMKYKIPLLYMFSSKVR